MSFRWSERTSTYTRVITHKRKHPGCPLVCHLYGGSSVDELNACEERISRSTSWESYKKWQESENNRVRLLELNKTGLKVYWSFLLIKAETTSPSEDESSMYFSFLFPLTKYLFQKFISNDDLEERYKVAFPAYDEIDREKLRIWTFVLREMILLNHQGLADMDIVRLLIKADDTGLFLKFNKNREFLRKVTKFRSSSLLKKGVLNIIAETEMISFFLALMSQKVRSELFKIKGVLIHEFPWTKREFKKFLTEHLLSAEEIVFVPQIYSKVFKDRQEDPQIREKMKRYLEKQLQLCYEKRHIPGSQETALRALELRWPKAPHGERVESFMYELKDDDYLLRQKEALVFFRYEPTTPSCYRKKLEMIMDVNGSNDKPTITYLINLRPHLDEYIARLTKKEIIIFYISLAKLEYLDVLKNIEDSSGLRDIDTNFRFLFQLIKLKDGMFFYDFIKKRRIDINIGSGYILRTLLLTQQKYDCRGSCARFVTLMTDEHLLINLKSRRNRTHSFLLLLRVDFSYLLRTDAIERFIAKGLILSNEELTEALEEMKYLGYNGEFDRRTRSGNQVSHEGMTPSTPENHRIYQLLRRGDYWSYRKALVALQKSDRKLMIILRHGTIKKYRSMTKSLREEMWGKEDKGIQETIIRWKKLLTENYEKQHIERADRRLVRHLEIIKALKAKSS